MNSLPGAAEAGERLKQTAMRDFAPTPEAHAAEIPGKSFRLAFGPEEAPVPALFKLTMNLIGLAAHGPGEKVAWWVNFTYKGEWCELAHQKFGVRLYLWTEASEDEARKTLTEVAKKLRSSMRTVERLILALAPDLLGQGNATVVNQHRSLRQAYEYFREKALNPHVIEDEVTVNENVGGGRGVSFRSGKLQMQTNAFYDLVAAISAYVSLLEHDLVLTLAFTDFDPAKDNLTEVIGDRWGEKFQRVLGKEDDATRFRQRLADVVERWRNPYSHGGFEKGHGATIYLHAPGVGAIPVGLTGIRNSPLFTLLPASESDIAKVFDLLVELDRWLQVELPHAMKWVNSGLAVRFDEQFRDEAAEAMRSGRFDSFVEMHEYRQDMIENMDY